MTSMQSTEREQEFERVVLWLRKRGIRVRYSLGLNPAAYAEACPAPVSSEPGEGEPAAWCSCGAGVGANAIQCTDCTFLLQDEVKRLRAAVPVGGDAGDCSHAAGRIGGLCKRCMAPVAPDEAYPVAGDGLVEEAAEELYAAGPWGEPFQFVNGGAHLITDAHMMKVYRDMAQMVLAVAARLSSRGGEA